MMRYLSLPTVFVASLILSLSCRGYGMVERYRPIMGYWKTEKGIIMSIHLSPDNTATASVKVSPGYITEDIQTGKALVTRIKRRADGRFVGIIEMPDGLKPVEVIMALSSPDTLLIMTWDRRSKSRVMRWERVRELQEK